MKAMVTGGAGFLAGHLIERLLHGGHGVRTVELPDRVTPELEKWGAEVVKGDLRHPDICARADLGYQPKVSVEEGLKRVYEWIEEKGLPEGL